MSVDLNWEALTSGPDGEALALKIRDFIHAKFQTVPLPRFIKSVKVHDFEFGSIPPRLELKDITDPLPDFYEENEEYEDDDDEEEEEKDTWEGSGQQPQQRPHQRTAPHHHRQRSHPRDPARPSSRVYAATTHTGSYSPIRGQTATGDLTASSLLGVSTPGILGGASNLHYFQSHLAGPAWSGTQTPLAAVAGAHHHLGPTGALTSAASSPSRGPWTPSHSRQASQSSISLGGGDLAVPPSQLREKSSVSTLAPTSVNTSRPPTRDTAPHLATAAAKAASAIAEDESDDDRGGGRRGRRRRSSSSSSRGRRTRRNSIRIGSGGTEQQQQQRRGGTTATTTTKTTTTRSRSTHGANANGSPDSGPRQREPRPEDLQAVFRIRYAGDVRLRLTAEILLDYPMPSFVGIPVQLSVTGLTFDGVGVLAYIRRRIHFCFLSPEDAVAAVGGPSADDDDDDDGENEEDQRRRQGDPDAAAGATMAGSKGRRFAGLLQEIRVESEIGLRDSGKQSLKNVGKVERFVLEQVRRIFENEFVYPSFWTFLV